MEDRNLLVRWILPASVAVNVFLAAALAVYIWRGAPNFPPPPHGGKPPALRLVEDMAQSLPAADAEILRTMVRRPLEDLEQARRRTRDVPNRLRAILRQEPFDKAAFRQQIEAMLQADEAEQRTMAELMPEAIARMSPEGRAKLAEMRAPRGSPPGHPAGPPPNESDGPPPPPRP